MTTFIILQKFFFSPGIPHLVGQPVQSPNINANLTPNHWPHEASWLSVCTCVSYTVRKVGVVALTVVWLLHLWPSASSTESGALSPTVWGLHGLMLLALCRGMSTVTPPLKQTQPTVVKHGHEMQWEMAKQKVMTKVNCQFCFFFHILKSIWHSKCIKWRAIATSLVTPNKHNDIFFFHRHISSVSST